MNPREQQAPSARRGWLVRVAVHLSCLVVAALSISPGEAAAGPHFCTECRMPGDVSAGAATGTARPPSAGLAARAARKAPQAAQAASAKPGLKATSHRCPSGSWK